jgi:hypothetical protein
MLWMEDVRAFCDHITTAQARASRHMRRRPGRCARPNVQYVILLTIVHRVIIIIITYIFTLLLLLLFGLRCVTRRQWRRRWSRDDLVWRPLVPWVRSV